MKKAIIVEFWFATRLVINEEEENIENIISLARPRIEEKVLNELEENLAEWYDDEECPYTPEEINRDFVGNSITTLLINGGETINPRTKKAANFEKGYMVSLKGYELKVEGVLEPDLEATLVAYLADTKDIWQKDENLYVGLWKDGEDYYFDISEWIINKEEAIARGKINDQLAIYGFAEGEISLENYKVGWFYDRHNKVINNLQQSTNGTWNVIKSPIYL